MRHANEVLTSRHLASILSTGDKFPGDYKELMGYYSWGSNDVKFDKRAYHSLGFAPGGIAETAVPTSARTFADPKAPWQSLIADLVAQGVTGCKGYVSEPGITAMAHPDILFDRYTAGCNFAESFYMASRHIHRKDMWSSATPSARHTPTSRRLGIGSDVRWVMTQPTRLPNLAGRKPAWDAGT